MAVDRIQDEVRADDPIQKFQGRWIGADGWEFPVHARYVAWGIFAFVLPLVMLGDWLLTGGISPLPLIDLTIAVGLTSMLANLTSGEVSLAHALVYLTRTVRSARRGSRRSAQPLTTSDRLGRLSRREPPIFDRRQGSNGVGAKRSAATHRPMATDVSPVIAPSSTERTLSDDAPVRDTSPEPAPPWPHPAYGPMTTNRPGKVPPPARFNQNQGRVP